jgi:RNA polymerase sigma-70 factor (ECF subfamily)
MMDEIESLVIEMQAGSKQAFEQLLERFQPLVFRLAHRVTGNREDAWDAVQEAFLAVHRRRLELREPGRFRPWLARIAHAVAVDRVRRRGGATAGAEPEDLAAPDEAGPTGRVEQAALQDELDRALAGLPGKYREPLLLSTHGSLSYEQISREMDCPVGTVRSRIAMARQLLRERLSAWLGRR